MAQSIEAQRASSIYAEMTFEDRLSPCLLVEEELRGNRSRERLFKNCQPARKTDPLSAPNIDPTFR